MSVSTNDRVRDLEVTLQQLRTSIPDSTGELREELERQQDAVTEEIMRELMNLME